MEKTIEERILEFTGDKRSREYRDLKEELDIKNNVTENNKTKGLGDVIETITKATGIKKAVELIFGSDCGCDERKKKLNKLFPFRVECLTEPEFRYIDDLLSRMGNKLSPNDQKEILIIYNRVFNTKKKPTSCSGCWREIIKHLKKLHLEYKKEME